jgi:replicative DNA helicase
MSEELTLTPRQVIERAVLGSAMLGHAGIIANELGDHRTAWTSAAHRRVAEAIWSLASTGQQTDELAVYSWCCDHLEGWESVAAQPATDPAWVAGLMESGSRSPTTAKAVARQLRHAHQRSSALEALQRCARTISESGVGVDPAPVIAEAVAAMRGIPADNGSDQRLGSSISEALADGLAARAAKEAGGTTVASWGVPSLDRLCPMEPGRMFILAAAPKCGKSSLAFQAALATAEEQAERGGVVAFASLEMGRAEIGAVMAGRILGIEASRVRRGSLSEEEVDAIRKLAAFWDSKDNFWIRDATGAGQSTCDSLCAWLRTRHQMSAKRLSLAVVDYLQLCEKENNRQSEYETVSANTRKLKLLAKDLRIPLLVLSQMNREGRKQRTGDDGQAGPQVEPTLNALRASGSIEQDADAVLFLHHPTTATGPMRVVRATLAASRFCQTGNTDLMFIGSNQTFIEQIETNEDRGSVTQSQRDQLAESAAEMMTP